MAGRCDLGEISIVHDQMVGYEISSRIETAAIDLAGPAPMRIDVFLNEGAGLRNGVSIGALRGEIHEAFAANKIKAVTHPLSPSGLKQEVRNAIAQGTSCVVAAGGDGTVSAVAATLAGTDTPLGVLPLGTLNHFAKDLGLPLDLAGSVRVIAEGQVISIDAAQVNNRLFVNNSSVGVYAKALVDRDGRREQTGAGKWRAMFGACWKMLRRSPLMRVRLATEDGVETIKTPLVFVGNNAYQLELLQVGKRARLDEGVLSLYVARTKSRRGLLKLVFHAALGRLEQARDFETRLVTGVEINSRRTRLHVSLDGEVTRLETPLTYSILPGALRVFAHPPSP